MRMHTTGSTTFATFTTPCICSRAHITPSRALCYVLFVVTRVLPACGLPFAVVCCCLPRSFWVLYTVRCRAPLAVQFILFLLCTAYLPRSFTYRIRLYYPRCLPLCTHCGLVRSRTCSSRCMVRLTVPFTAVYLAFCSLYFLHRWFLPFGSTSSPRSTSLPRACCGSRYRLFVAVASPAYRHATFSSYYLRARIFRFARLTAHTHHYHHYTHAAVLCYLSGWFLYAVPLPCLLPRTQFSSCRAFCAASFILPYALYATEDLPTCLCLIYSSPGYHLLVPSAGTTSRRFPVV